MSETQIKWDENCLKCQAEHGGVCVSAACKRHHYDEWGDKIPDEVYYMDGNALQEYIEKKRKQKAKKAAFLEMMQKAKM